MNQLTSVTSQMAWSDPILPIIVDREWEEEVRADLGMLPDVLRRLSPSRWMGQAMLKWTRIPIREFPVHLADMGALITAQENACRYCYGVARSYLKMFGHSDKAINRIERDMQLGELDEKERVYIRFCRNLARSSPRPPREEREKLISLGFSPLAVAEMAFHIANHCFTNRVSTFVACEPMHNLEKVSYGLMAKIMRPMMAKKIRGMATTDFKALPEDLSNFPHVVQALKGTTGAAALNEALEGAFVPSRLSQELKVLIFAIVAKSLECKFCFEESRSMANSIGLSNQEFDSTLKPLRSKHLSPEEELLLDWSRETVHYETGAIQMRNREIVKTVDPGVFLEAIGIASLANTVVRLAILLE